MKTTKELFGIFTLTLALSAPVQAQFTYTDNGNGTCTIINYTGPGGAVDIPFNINGLTVSSIGYEAFYDCPNYARLTSVSIPSSVTSIGVDAFYGCYNLASVTIDNEVTSIGDGAFFLCSHLTSVTIPGSVTSIGDSTFGECASLTSVTIGSGVTSMGQWAFALCPSLTSAYFLGNAPSADSTVFGDSRYPLDPVTIYYLPGTTGWNTFSAITGVPAVLWNTPPSIAITSPTSGAIYSTSSSTISLGGTASDNMGVVNVTWSNPQTGGSGTASGTTSWTANNISLASGANAITVTAYDAAGDQSTATLTVRFITNALQVMITGLYNTGVNNDGTLATLDTADSHYALVSLPSGSAGTAWVVAPQNAAWWSGTTNANWLSPAIGAPWPGPGQYDYRLVFNMVDAVGHPLDPTTATITGNWAADDEAMLFLNGTWVVNNNTGFASLASFAVSSGFRSGTNTLDFLVINAPNMFSPSGLLVSDLSGIAALFAPVAGTAYYARPANISLKIAISDLLTNVTDVDGFPIALVGVGTDGLNLLSTNGTTLFTNSTYIFYSNSVTPNVNDSFNYTVSDGHGGTGIGTVLITMNNSIIGQANVNLTVSSTNVTANFFGVPGFQYTVERSTNLTQGLGWVPISTNTAPANGLMQVVDNFQDLGIPIPPVPSTAYYRLRYNP